MCVLCLAMIRLLSFTFIAFSCSMSCCQLTKSLNNLMFSATKSFRLSHERLTVYIVWSMWWIITQMIRLAGHMLVLNFALWPPNKIFCLIFIFLSDLLTSINSNYKVKRGVAITHTWPSSVCLSRDYDTKQISSRDWVLARLGPRSLHVLTGEAGCVVKSDLSALLRYPAALSWEVGFSH